MRFFTGLCVALLVVSGFAASQSAAEGWSRVGYGRLINNDYLGDLQDREQTGSYVSSRLYARGALNGMPARAGDLLEFRLQGDIKAPDSLTNPRASDRPFAGTLTFGLHTHYRQMGWDIAMGAELAVTGPQTRLDELQTALHNGLGIAAPSAQIRAAQIGNRVYPGAVVEMAHEISVSDRLTLRPFVEGRAGVETLIRTGFDLAIGEIGRESMQIRDGITGQRYRTVLTSSPGVAAVFGVDTAHVSSSAYLPAARGYTLTNMRTRARAGLHWQGKNGHGFFGVTYLGKEYVSQTSAQFVGSIRVAIDF